MQNIAPNKAILALQYVIYGLWPSTLWAASITLDQSLREVPGLAWIMVMLLATVSSLAALLSKLKDETPPRLGFFVASHMVGSWLAGMLAFFACEGFEVHDFIEVIIIATAAYAGAQLVDRFALGLTNRVVGEVEGGVSAPKAGEKPE